MGFKKLIVANWKVNPDTPALAKALFSATIRLARQVRRATVVVAPPFPYLSFFPPKEKKLKLGAQSVFYERGGAFTGEVSAGMLQSLGVSFVIIGHSERRVLGESDTDVSKKVKATFRAGLTPIICVGETERDSHGDYLAFLGNQIRKSLAGVSKGDAKKLVIAYEPVWAIGGKNSKNAMSARDLHQMTIFVRKVATSLFGREVADGMTIIYGGSVKPDNAGELMKEGNVAGFLVGGASLDPKAFGEIINAVDKS